MELRLDRFIMVGEKRDIWPILLKFGVGLALFFAGFLYSRIRTRRVIPKLPPRDCGGEAHSEGQRTGLSDRSGKAHSEGQRTELSDDSGEAHSEGLRTELSDRSGGAHSEEDAATITRTSSEAGSTSNDTSGALFDVFLSFRGPDTRLTFTDTLYYALLEKGIRVFIDKKGIDAGDEIGPEIYQAIDDSKVCIPIFSTGYASSRWCLRELEHMMKRRKTHKLEVMPIFYDVEPSVVKLETGVYRDVLTQHKRECGNETVQGWEEALKEVTKIKGWNAKNIGYGELTRQIALEVLGKLDVSVVHLHDPLVGIDKSVDKVIDLLSVEHEDIRLVGICGIGGIGKTTLAKIIYKKLSARFQSCSFLHDIRQASESSSFGLLDVQRQLVRDILGDKRIEIPSIDEGKNIIEIRFRNKKVLIILDDVNEGSQLRALAAEGKWFGSGSRILVTTRDKSVLSVFENSLSYEVEELNSQESLELFSKCAFGSNFHFPPSDFLTLSEDAIARAGGLPLTIEVIGSLLRGKEEAAWKDILRKMEIYPCEDVLKHLRLSYEALDVTEKDIFLDVACFLAGKNKRDATYMWDDCRLFPEQGIQVLLSRSLVKIREENELWMHDQLKDLGRGIVLAENYNNPGRRSRVWNHKDALGMITKEKGSETVEAICVDLDGISLTSKEFKKFPNIRYLEMTSRNLSEDFKDVFPELRWLSWKKCPSILQANHFFPKELLILDLSGSDITEHWDGWTQLKVVTRLKVLNLSSCWWLVETPDLSTFLSLEILILRHCRALEKLSNSIGMLKCLVELDISNSRILELPNTIVNLGRLKVLKMGGSCVQKLPEAICMMEKLEEIHGNNCEGLKMIPSDIGRLPLLKILALTATLVENVPELPQSLISLCLSSRAVGKIPEIYNRVNLPSLRNLELCFGKNNDETFVYYESEQQPHAFSSSRMKLLNITSVTSFGGWFHCARELELIRCKTLCQIQHLPSGLRKLKIRDCSLLEVVDLSNLENLLKLSLLNNQNCHIQGLEGLASLQCLKVYNCRSSKFSGLERLKNLQLLQLKMCPSLQTLLNLSNLKNLKEFKLWDCPKLVEIEGLDRLESPESLDIQCCSSLQSLLDLSHLKKLKNLHRIQQLPSGLRKLKISECHLLEVVDLSNLENLLELSLINNEICDVQGLEGLASLQCLRVDNCKSSKFSGLERLKNLRLLQLRMCWFLQTLPNLSNFKNLKDFELWYCPELVQIEGLDRLESLERLDILCCSSLQNLPLSHLKKLKMNQRREKPVARRDDLPF